MTHPAQVYTQHLNTLMGREAEFFRITDENEPHPLWVLFYSEAPAPGHLCAFTFGLSEVEHAAWTASKPELMLCLQSQAVDWALALGHIAKAHRGDLDYSAGSIFDLEEPIAQDSSMTGFLLHSALLLPEDAPSRFQLPDRKIHLMGAYPLYKQEMDRINLFGLELFFTGDVYDPYSVTRPARGQ